MFGASGVHAATRSPEIVVREIFDQLLAELDAKRAKNELTDATSREIFAEILNPRIDYISLTRWILRDYWKNASEEQRTAFLDAFKTYIINTYALALSSKKEIRLDVADNPKLGKNTAIVSGEFTVEDADPVPIEFRLIARDERWLLFDVTFAGVSLALTFRSDFTYVAKEGGIESVTTHLRERASGQQ